MTMTNQGKYPIEPESLVGQVRTLISDDEAKNVSAGLGEFVWYSDAGIQALLRVWNSDPKRVAIYILRLMHHAPHAGETGVKRGDAEPIRTAGITPGPTQNPGGDAPLPRGEEDL